MKTSHFLSIVLMLITTCLTAQQSNIDKYLFMKPSEIKSGKSGTNEYQVSLKWQNLDAIHGTRFNCNALKAKYISGLENDSVCWKDVSLAPVSNFQQQEYTGIYLPSFDGFTYKIDETNFLSTEFYAAIQPEYRDIAKWLVSDAVQMQGLAWYVFDSLEYNKAFTPEFLNNYDIKFKDWVTFTSRYQKLIWTGISKMNNEVCAVIRFESLYNPVKMDNSEMSVQGRSMYYGEIWISLSDKEVEYSTMVEDVVMKLRSPTFPEDQLIDLQREIVFTKVD